MYLTQALHKGVIQNPDADALVFGTQRLSFSQLAGRAARLGAALKAIGMAPGDRVGMMALNSARYVEFFYGTWWGGGVINPVNIRWSPKEVAYSLDDCDTRILLIDDNFAAQAPMLRELSRSLKTLVYVGDGPVPEGMLGYEDLLAANPPMEDSLRGNNDLAAVMYTGGTTGMPKGVMLSHSNIYVNALGGMATVPREPGLIGVLVSPMFHVAGCGSSIQYLMRGAPQVVIASFDEVKILEAIQRERATDLFLVPTMIKRVIEHPRFGEFDLSSLRMLTYGAAPIDAALLTRAMEAFPNARFCQAYGMTELSPTISVLTPQHHLPGPQQAGKLRSAGLPTPVAEVRIVDPEGKELPRGEIGEIAARGPMVMQGYWNKPEETAKAIRNGWMHTGDGGYMDKDGLIYVVDRIKDMVVTGGENVYSAEVENAIAQLPQVSMSAVIGVPDDKWGERVHAVIVLREGQSLTAEQVMAHCKTLIAGYKCPRSVEFRTELPLSAAGKLQKFQLRAPFWEGKGRKVN